MLDAPDGSGDQIVILPDKVMNDIGWQSGDTVEVELQSNGALSISKCQENVRPIDDQVLTRAQETFGSIEKAERWLHSQHLILGMSPAEFLNGGGARDDVLKILGAICHGGPV